MPVVQMEEVPVELADAGPRIYTITVVRGNPNGSLEGSFANRLRSRSWGYYFQRADAEYTIEHNETDISEMGHYPYALLSSLGEGPLAIPEELQWYEFVWDYDAPPDEEGYQIPLLIEVRKIDKPEMYEHMLFGEFRR